MCKSNWGYFISSLGSEDVSLSSDSSVDGGFLWRHPFLVERVVCISVKVLRKNGCWQRTLSGWMMEGHFCRTEKLSESGGKHVRRAIDLIEWQMMNLLIVSSGGERPKWLNGLTDPIYLPSLIEHNYLSVRVVLAPQSAILSLGKILTRMCVMCVFFLESKVEGGKSLVLTNVVQKLHEPVASRCIERHARQAVNSSGTNGDAHQHWGRPQSNGDAKRWGRGRAVWMTRRAKSINGTGVNFIDSSSPFVTIQEGNMVLSESDRRRFERIGHRGRERGRADISSRIAAIICR